MRYCETLKFQGNLVLQIEDYCHLCRYLISQIWKLYCYYQCKIKTFREYLISRIFITCKISELSGFTVFPSMKMNQYQVQPFVLIVICPENWSIPFFFFFFFMLRSFWGSPKMKMNQNVLIINRFLPYRIVKETNLSTEYGISIVFITSV